MSRVACRVLSDGQIYHLHPFHICLKGLEQAILCREEADYDVMVKLLCVCAHRQQVRIIIYCVVSNHCHVAVLAKNMYAADAYCRDLKKTYSLYFHNKYQVNNLLHRVEIKALCLDTDAYLRNALAYIAKNAQDNGATVNDYPWSGFRAMFSRADSPKGARSVAQLTYRECRTIMHTGFPLRDVPWLLDEQDHLIPSSICDYVYLEQAFKQDSAFFLRLVGGVDQADMRHQLEEKPYRRQSDTEYYKTVDEISKRWYKQGLTNLSTDQKARLISYLDHTTRTTDRQLARILGLPVDHIKVLLRKNPGLEGSG